MRQASVKKILLPGWSTCAKPNLKWVSLLSPIKLGLLLELDLSTFYPTPARTTSKASRAYFLSGPQANPAATRCPLPNSDSNLIVTVRAIRKCHFPHLKCISLGMHEIRKKRTQSEISAGWPRETFLASVSFRCRSRA
jgi:hypothetical protein